MDIFVIIGVGLLMAGLVFVVRRGEDRLNDVEKELQREDQEIKENPGTTLEETPVKPKRVRKTNSTTAKKPRAPRKKSTDTPLQ